MAAKLTLIQPRHIYAPDFKEKQLGHIYMPTSLIAIASVLKKTGIQVSLYDENIDMFDWHSNIIGINLLGAPYIPCAIDYLKKLNDKFGENNYRLVIGGQVVNGLTKEQFFSLFGKNAINGNNIHELASLFGLRAEQFSPVEKISFIDGYNLLDDNNFRLYLQTEAGFYLSQGCKYSCTFCGASRSRINPITNQKERCVEQYRDIDMAVKDIEFLIQKSLQFDIHELNFYLSNLDLFQTPDCLSKFADKLLLLKEKYLNFDIHFRALATVKSFLDVHKNCPELLFKLVKVGLNKIGFGVDGASPIVWKKTKKPHTKSACINAIKVIKETYGIIPEILMVFGYDEFDNEETLKLTLDFAHQMNDIYGAIPRPHVAKDVLPGSDNWYKKEYAEKVNCLINNPNLFVNLDFTALPSEITHANERFRELTAKYYLEMCAMSDSLTQYVKPISQEMSDSELQDVVKFNLERYDF